MSRRRWAVVLAVLALPVTALGLHLGLHVHNILWGGVLIGAGISLALEARALIRRMI